MMKHIGLVVAASLALAACAGTSPIPPAQQPAVDAKAAAVAKEIGKVCIGSGLFTTVNGLAAGMIPVPGVALAAELVNAGVDQVCAHPDRFAQDASTVAWLVKNGLHKKAA